MFSSPRSNRGTSIIAALVFAAILGAIALSLNSLNSNSVNTPALSAAACAPAGSSTTNCEEGYDYNITVGPSCTYTPNPIAPDLGTIDSQNELADTNLKRVQMCPPGAQALKDAKFKYLRTGLNGQVVGQLQSTFIEQPLAQRTQCNNGKSTTNTITCTYKLSGNNYQLQTSVSGKIGPWTCHVSFNDPNGTTPTEQCWVKDVPLGNGVNDTPPGQPGSGEVQPNATTGGNLTITPAKSLTLPNPSKPYYVGNTDENGNTIWCDQNGDCLAKGSTCTGDGASQTCQNPDGSQIGNTQGNPGINSGPNCTTNPPQNGGSCTTPTSVEGTCVNGVCTPTNSGPGNPGNPGGPSGPGGPGGALPHFGHGNQGGLGGLSSLLGGISRGLQPCAQNPYQNPYQYQNPYAGGAGTLVPVQVYDPTIGTWRTTYVQQTPQYGQYGYGGYGSQPCAQQQTPYGVGNNGQACPQPPSQPQCAPDATPKPLSASGNGCTTGYQCVPTSSTIGQTPTPQIACSPQVADVGQSVTISYSCTNATGSSGAGFSTNNQMSGSATTTIQAPPSGTNTANFGLTCTGNGQTASAQCKVQVSQPAIDLVADPRSVPSGQTATIGWVTAGMQSCVISSPQDQNFTQQNAGSTNVNGVAQTDPITADTEFDLTCKTLGGQTKTASTVVSIGATSTSSSMNVNSSADGQTINHGATVTIAWTDSNASSSSATALWLIDLSTEQATALIASDQPLSGSYTWQVPAAGGSCNSNSYAVCAPDLVAGHSYGIEAALYTPPSAYIGPAAAAPAGAVSPTYSDYGYTADPFTVGQ